MFLSSIQTVFLLAHVYSSVIFVQLPTKNLTLFLSDLQNNGVIKDHLYTKQTRKFSYYLAGLESRKVVFQGAW